MATQLRKCRLPSPQQPVGMPASQPASLADACCITHNHNLRSISRTQPGLMKRMSSSCQQSRQWMPAKPHPNQFHIDFALLELLRRRQGEPLLFLVLFSRLLLGAGSRSAESGLAGRQSRGIMHHGCRWRSGCVLLFFVE